MKSGADQGISEVDRAAASAPWVPATGCSPAVAQIDQDSITDPVARELLAKFRANGIEVALNDFSLDTGIPTISALAWDPTTFPEQSEIVHRRHHPRRQQGPAGRRFQQRLQLCGQRSARNRSVWTRSSMCSTVAGP